jgi:predicted RNA-binding Zn-ribbon protein involved in translation (DUF1610 family)
MSNTLKVHKQFKCNGCGGELRLINKRTRFVGCPYCGAVADVNTEAHKVIAQMEKPSKFPPYTFLRVGMIATFEGIKYQIIGRTRFVSNFKEFWQEENQKGYTDERWEYDEWQLMGEDFTYFYLIEDAEGFKSSHVFYPQFPNLPKGDFIQDFNTNKQKRINEYGSSNIVYFEGEATYEVRVGSTHSFAMYKGGKENYEVETRLSDTKEAKEISFYREKSYQIEEILTAFGEDERLKTFKQSFESLKRSRRMVRRMYLVASIIYFFLMFFSLAENDVFTQNFKLSDYKMVSQTDSLTEYVIYSDFFELKDLQRVHGFNLTVNMPDNMDSYTEIQVQDEQKNVVNELAGNFYRASGDEAWAEDGESGIEHWEENETSITEFYQLDSAGRYQVKMNVQISKNQPEQVFYTLRVTQTNLSRYYTIGFFVCMFMAIFASRKPNVLKELKKVSKTNKQ